MVSAIANKNFTVANSVQMVCDAILNMATNMINILRCVIGFGEHSMDAAQRLG